MKFINIIFAVTMAAVIAMSVPSCGDKHAAGDGHNHSTESKQHSHDTEHNHDEHAGHDGHSHDGHDHSEHSHDDGHDHHGHAHDDEQNDDHDHSGHGHHGHGEDEGLYLTREQMETIGLEFGDFSQVKINDFVQTTGKLGLPPNAYASVNTKSAGFIKGSNKYVEGSYVNRGATIAYLENPDFIQKQQDYLEAAAELSYLEQDFDRQQKLVEANAGVEKNLQKLQAEVAVKKAQKMGIAKYLGYLGFDVATVSPENLQQSIPVTAPISGYITSIDMHNGMYVSPEQELVEIADDDHLHLELDVFEKDIAHVREGQQISYLVPALGNTMYRGEVYIIGKEFNTTNKTVRIHGHLTGDRPQFVKELFVQAKIWLTDQTVQALPEEAIIKDGTSYYIYIARQNREAKEVEFEKRIVIPRNSSDGYTSISLLDEIPNGMQIVTKGAYYVYAQSKAGELKHEH